MRDRMCVEPDKDPNKRYLREHFDAGKLCHILSHPNDFKHVLQPSKRQEERPEWARRGGLGARNGTRDEIIDMCSRYLANSTIDDNMTGVYEAEYYRASEGRGRWTPAKGMSLGSLSRKVRHIIANDFYTDIDAVNCHPTILLHLCSQMGLDTPVLQRYVYERDTVFAEVMGCLHISKDDAKVLMLMIVYGGEKLYRDLRGDTCAVVKAFKAEIETIGRAFCTKYPHELGMHMRRRRDKTKWEGSDIGSFFNMYVIEEEVKMLEVIYDEMMKRGLCGDDGRDVILCYDGLMVRKTTAVGPELLDELSAMIEAQLGLKIKLTIKVMEPVAEAISIVVVLDDTWVKYLDEDRWDEFSKMAIGMPVIANDTARGRGYCNNQMFRVAALGDVVVLEDTIDGGQISVSQAVLRADFRPGYCITSHKAQGCTIRQQYGVHELVKMGPHGAYVALTRASDIGNIVLFQ